MQKREPSIIELKSRQRIIELIQDECDGSQQVFADRAGIGKGSVSQYVNGRNFPSNLTAGQIGSAFGVSPAWVMGFDVSKYPSASSVAPSAGAPDRVERYVEIFRGLPAESQKAIMAMIDYYNVNK